MNSAKLLESGTLWTKLKQQTKLARERGALQSIKTEHKFIEQDGITFVVHTLSSLARKETAKQKQKQHEIKTGKRSDPFLPYEKDLFVGNLSSTHFCLLNKFNVVEHHLLIVTRAFEEQTDLLNLNDFEALHICMQEIDGLAFYNGGKIAGASQAHKHLQLLPLPIIPNLKGVPIDKAIAEANFNSPLATISNFTFRHAIALLDKNYTPQMMLDNYYALLEKVGFDIDKNVVKQPGAYNLLVTNNWMLLVPRSQEAYHGIAVNSLGFAGSLFVRDRAAWELLQSIAPIEVLHNVAIEL
ncbi:phosphorylase [Myxosarcina sp. GI1]|uniref:ATP adenylyltransferase family protein n=1 Tax=Myxosarcina sp. GI1 TaxID=1541065 RepID=UPI0005655AD9|nr:phosphorylase [Myxosarcina sp. GI1]